MRKEVMRDITSFIIKKCHIYPPSTFYRLITGQEKLRTTFLQGREDDAARSKTSTNTINVEHSYKMKAILNSKSYYFPLVRLLLGLYDYRLKHISIFNYKNDHQHDQAHNNQSRGRLLFQEREDDVDIPTECSTLVVLRYICERGGATIHGEEANKKKQVDQFGQGGSSKFCSDKFG
jgi:hypothetical protein